MFIMKSIGLILSAMIICCVSCSSMNLSKKAEEALALNRWDLAVARYSQLCKKNPDDLACLQKYHYAKVKAAHHHYEKAEILLKNMYNEEALVEIEVAADLLPGDSSIQDKLKEIRNYIIKEKKADMNVVPTPEKSAIILSGFEEPALNLATDEPIDMFFDNVSLKTILQTMSKVASINIVFDADLEDRSITINLKKVSFLDALKLLATISNNSYKIINPSTVLIYPTTQQKVEYYQESFAKVFFVSHADVEDIARALRGALGLKFISTDKNLSIIVIKDTLQRLKSAEKLISIYDKPRPEVIIEVEIIELNRNKMHEYGLQIASQGSQGIETSLVPDDEIRLDPGPILSRSQFVLVNMPSLTFRLIKSSSDASLIASLPLRTVQGQTGRVRFGQEVPVPQTTFAPIAQGGVNQQPITSFIYRNIGINIDVTPHVHLNNDITLDVAIESSSLAGQGYGGIPIFGTSRVEKSIRLQENETSIIAGLQKEELRTIMEGIPGLSDLPGIGKLFSRNSKTVGEIEIILALTPHLISSLQLSPDDFQTFRIEEGPGKNIPVMRPQLPIPDKQNEENY
ncbi:MAG: hypothetical protein A2Y62_15540 [Candidatus Fischerbacteria bacterium RBG_13_37_8]|uniref:Secretin/TonB short N-terminal domain-containing protein n=1 Tax=Candidatus Fischerbacteria bacterium RBG_13_37_8 TaxID=1817863 RepID=A0A1F5VL33_9BACT|nr:MAG: hypothetical protein A2Y62_15540 [Candidatus Fischerbacteria bacterium RBG_13_37_8]